MLQVGISYKLHNVPNEQNYWQITNNKITVIGNNELPAYTHLFQTRQKEHLDIIGVFL